MSIEISNQLRPNPDTSDKDKVEKNIREFDQCLSVINKLANTNSGV